MPYAVDDAVFSACCSGFSLWAQGLIREKLAAVKELESPRAAGGRYGDKWAYPVGKFHIICHIDDDARLVKVLAVVSIA